MGIRTTLVIASTFSLMAGCAAGTSQQHTSQPTAQCAALGDVSGQVADIYANKVSAVKPVKRTEFKARAIQPKVIAGAELYVPGERGMSEAYLDRMMSCHAASNTPSQHPNDPLRAAAIEGVEVDSVGSHYRVTITGRDRAAGEAIWQSARTLDPSSTVHVQQIASAVASPAL